MRKPLLYNHMNTAGHQNDTIVVNQPRLTADDVITTVNTSTTSSAQLQPQLEMTIITDEQGNQKIVPTNSLVSTSKEKHMKCDAIVFLIYLTSCFIL